MRRTVLKNLCMMVIIASLVCSGLFIPVKAYSQTNTTDNGTCYEHDPRLNEKAMEDIIYDPTAVYGFRPDPDSVRLGDYADYDWSDPVLVSKSVDDRIEYLIENRTLYSMYDSMLKEGKSTEEIARALSAERNRIRLASYDGDPVGLSKVKNSNLKKYGNENGPTAESLFEKYGSWDTVILKSFSSNPGMDACLGLYDITYENNMLTGQVVEKDSIVYTVKKNDNICKIAQKYYGTQSKWYDIYKANKDVIDKDYIIHEGDKLVIPMD